MGISACGTVEIKNHEFCGDDGEFGAQCFHTLSDDNRHIFKKDWDIERVGMICAKPEVFGDWKSVIMKLCHKSKKCTYEVEQKLTAFFENVEKITSRAVE